MVSARAIIAEVERRGVQLEVVGDRLRATPKTAITPELSETIGVLKAQIIAELQERARRPIGIMPKPTDAVIAAARLLREGKWPQTAPVCAFHVGRAAEACRRCGASWDEHYPAPVDGAAP